MVGGGGGQGHSTGCLVPLFESSLTPPPELKTCLAFANFLRQKKEIGILPLNPRGVLTNMLYVDPGKSLEEKVFEHLKKEAASIRKGIAVPG